MKLQQGVGGIGTVLSDGYMRNGQATWQSSEDHLPEIPIDIVLARGFLDPIDELGANPILG